MKCPELWVPCGGVSHCHVRHNGKPSPTRLPQGVASPQVSSTYKGSMRPASLQVMANKNILKAPFLLIKSKGRETEGFQRQPETRRGSFLESLSSMQTDTTSSKFEAQNFTVRIFHSSEIKFLFKINILNLKKKVNLKSNIKYIKTQRVLTYRKNNEWISRMITAGESHL